MSRIMGSFESVSISSYDPKLLVFVQTVRLSPSNMTMSPFIRVLVVRDLKIEMLLNSSSHIEQEGTIVVEQM